MISLVMSQAWNLFWQRLCKTLLALVVRKFKCYQCIATDHNSLMVTTRPEASKCSESFENSTMSDSWGGFGNQRLMLLSLIASCAAALFVWKFNQNSATSHLSSQGLDNQLSSPLRPQPLNTRLLVSIFNFSSSFSRLPCDRAWWRSFRHLHGQAPPRAWH